MERLQSSGGRPGRLPCLAIGAVLLVGGCRGTEPGPPDPLALPTGTPEPALPPGVYASDAAGPNITFNIPDGWLGRELLAGFQLLAADQPGAILVTRFHGFVWSDPCVGRRPQVIETEPERLVSWLDEHDHLGVTAARQVTIAERAALQIDVTALVPPGCPVGRFLVLWDVPGEGALCLGENEKARVIVFSTGDRTIAIVIRGVGPDFDSFLARSEAVLETVRVEDA